MKIIDFVKKYADKPYVISHVSFMWAWADEGVDKEYNFEGSAKEFVEKFTKEYDCLDSFELDDLYLLAVLNNGRVLIQMVLVVS